MRYGSQDKKKEIFAYVSNGLLYKLKYGQVLQIIIIEKTRKKTKRLSDFIFKNVLLLFWH